MKRATGSLFLFLICAAPAGAQVSPIGDANPHLQQVDFDAGKIVELRGAPNYEMMVELSPDEQVESVALGDPSSWQVNVAKSGDRLFLKPAQAGSMTNMTVVTSLRVYNFELASEFAPAPDMPYAIQFRYPAATHQADDGQYVDVAAATRRISRYKVSGDRLLRPSQVSNDGERTFVSWPSSASIPAVYAIDSRGEEVLVNGSMRTDDVYVIDGVPDKLMFRIDDHVAYAARTSPKRTR